MIGRDAFQETDIIGITQPITKHSILVEDVTELAGAVHEAFAVATEGRPGPVLIDVPKDVQTARAVWTERPEHATPSSGSTAPSGQSAIDEAIRLITLAHRPLIMAAAAAVEGCLVDVRGQGRS